MDPFRTIIHTFGGCKMIFSPDTRDNTIFCTLSNSDEIVTHWNKIKLGNLMTLEKFYNILIDALDNVTDNDTDKNTESSFTSMKLTKNGIDIKIDFDDEYYDCLKLFQSDRNIISNKGFIKIKLIRFYF